MYQSEILESKHWQLRMSLQELRGPGQDCRIDRLRPDGRLTAGPKEVHSLLVRKQTLCVRQQVLRAVSSLLSLQDLWEKDPVLLFSLNSVWCCPAWAEMSFQFTTSPDRAWLSLHGYRLSFILTSIFFFFLKGLKKNEPFSSSAAITVFP